MPDLPSEPLKSSLSLAMYFTDKIGHIQCISEHSLRNLPAHRVWLYFSSPNEHIQDYI